MMTTSNPDRPPPDVTGVVFRVDGHVQGVGFRWWVRSKAIALSIRGTVSNRADGSVEIVAFGPPDAIEQLRTDLQDGPPGANVAHVSESSTPAARPPDDFSISS